MRRSLGLFLVVVGLVASVIGLSSGCGTLFSFNGRHPIAVEPLVPGAPLEKSIAVHSGKRYTLAVQVVFDREGLGATNGALVVQARFPLEASLGDAKANGWLDPEEAPSVLYGQSTDPTLQRRPKSVGPLELVAERLVGPYRAPFDQTLAYTVDLGPDRVGLAHVHEARVILYDDTLPTSITVAFAAAGVGLLVLVSGVMLLLYGVLRASRGGTRRRQTV